MLEKILIPYENYFGKLCNIICKIKNNMNNFGTTYNLNVGSLLL